LVEPPMAYLCKEGRSLSALILRRLCAQYFVTVGGELCTAHEVRRAQEQLSRSLCVPAWAVASPSASVRQSIGARGEHCGAEHRSGRRSVVSSRLFIESCHGGTTMARPSTVNACQLSAGSIGPHTTNTTGAVRRRGHDMQGIWSQFEIQTMRQTQWR